MQWAAETPRLRYQLAIEKEGTGLVGSCGVRKVEEDLRTASFGCEVGRKHWGQGYAYEASHALFGFAFSELEVERIFAVTWSGNVAALGLAQKLGMRPADEPGTSHDRATDSVTLVLRSSDWRG